MDLSHITLLDILTGTAIGMALGAFWYSPVAFGPAWMACLGKTPETLGDRNAPMIGALLASLLTACGMAVLHSASAIDSLAAALWLGLVVGLLLIFPAFLSDYLFSGWSRRLLLIQAGYRVSSVLLMSIGIFYI